MQAVRDWYKDQVSQRMQAVRQARQELETMMSGTSNASEMREKHRQIIGLRQQLEEVQFESTLRNARSALTAEQRSQLSQLMQQRRQTAKNRMQNGQKPQ